MAGDAEQERGGSRQGREQPRAQHLEHVLAGHTEAQVSYTKAEELLLRPGLGGESSGGGAFERALEGS